MTTKIVGKQDVNYVSRKTNKPVTGVTLHCVGESQNVNGMAVDTVYISSASPMFEQVLSYPLGSEIMISYNRYGSVESVTLCKNKA
mgnify:FL=1